MLNNLFTVNEEANLIAGVRNLPGTAELTSLASSLAQQMLKTMDANAEAYAERIQMSTSNSAALDEIVKELIPGYEATFLLDLDDTTVDNMLKSQQSKRSRAKSKAMTMDNYLTMLTAAVAEHIIRETTGRAKTGRGASTRASLVEYTDGQLEMFAADQDMLRREIRNIQSKKSIMKSKIDFSESDERWIALLKAEQQLKSLRTGGSTMVYVDETKDRIRELLAEVEISKLNSKEAHELLETVKGMVFDEEQEAERLCKQPLDNGMRKITSTVTYTAPNWNFCNSDNLVAGEVTTQKCRFCQKTRDGYKCLLYDRELSSKGKFVDKTRECCMAAAGYESVITEPAPAPSIDPQSLMKQAVDLYAKTYADLLNQGYPDKIADQVAREYVLGNK